MRGPLRRLWDSPARHVLQNLAMAVPGARALARRAHRTGAMNDPAEIARRAARLASSMEAEGLPLAGARLVEVGPGHTLGLAVSLLEAGASGVTAVDTVAYAEPPPASMNLRYRIVGPDGRWPLEDGSADGVYSFSVLEHVRDPEALLGEACRVLRPGGLSIHSIDLRDHGHLDDDGWLRFLRHSDGLWDLMMSRRSNWCNRLRAPDWEALLSRRFERRRFEAERRPLPPGLALDSRFRAMGEEDLSVSMLWVVGAKRGS